MASVAPDAASLAAARKLAGTWSHAGNRGLALWGLCQGSGSKPYQAVVDLRGPAYKCSCPSRKFPCKHALGLLVEWSEGRVPSTDEPADFAAEWLLRREEKAETRGERAETGDEAPKKAPDPATAQKRADRVASGLVELDLWFTDQIRSGLAAMDTSWAGFDAVAARMVDAQAPGCRRHTSSLGGHRCVYRELARESPRRVGSVAPAGCCASEAVRVAGRSCPFGESTRRLSGLNRECDGIDSGERELDDSRFRDHRGEATVHPNGVDARQEFEAVGHAARLLPRVTQFCHRNAASRVSAQRRCSFLSRCRGIAGADRGHARRTGALHNHAVRKHRHCVAAVYRCPRRGSMVALVAGSDQFGGPVVRRRIMVCRRRIGHSASGRG